jgi:predicted DNA-binding protein (MmcQ/YjbR family)
MNIEEVREYCIAKKGVTEEFPFNDDALVFKVAGKMFLLISISEPDSFNVKCDPEEAIELREKYDEITSAYHMNKKHWNTVQTNAGLPEKMLHKFIDDSYNLVVAGLSGKDKKLLGY